MNRRYSWEECTAKHVLIDAPHTLLIYTCLNHTNYKYQYSYPSSAVPVHKQHLHEYISKTYAQKETEKSSTLKRLAWIRTKLNWGEKKNWL